MRVAVLCAASLMLMATSAHAVVPTVEQPVVQLRALDKVTARVEEIELPVGQTIEFGSLSIMARTCRVTLPEETPPESAAYLEIVEFKAAAQKQPIVQTSGSVPVFTGWMFASSPALSALEHPIYDIWVTGCKDKSSPSK
jgi:hypothetical protein